MNRQDVQLQPRQKPQPVPHPIVQPTQNAQNQGGQGLRLVLSVAWMVILPDSAPTSCSLLEQEASHDLKGSRTITMARLIMWLLKKLKKLKMLYWVCSLQTHTLQQFYLIQEHRIPLYHHHL
jgi:hypothetical protein